MKIIFLDIDGVLNGPVSSWDGFPHSHIDKTMVGRLNEIIAATGAKVVISSSWRFRFPFTEMDAILKHQGFVGEIIDQTPKTLKNYREIRFSQVIPRGWEIEEWLEDHADLGIESFIILDDINNMDKLKHRLILTNGDVGLTNKHVKRAIKWLSPKKAEE